MISKPEMPNHYEVVVLKESELFQTRWIDPALPPGSVYNASNPLTKDELRARLETMGRSKAEIDLLIHQATSNSA